MLGESKRVKDNGCSSGLLEWARPLTICEMLLPECDY